MLISFVLCVVFFSCRFMLYCLFVDYVVNLKWIILRDLKIKLCKINKLNVFILVYKNYDDYCEKNFIKIKNKIK